MPFPANFINQLYRNKKLCCLFYPNLFNEAKILVQELFRDVDENRFGGPIQFIQHGNTFIYSLFKLQTFQNLNLVFYRFM